MKVAAAAVLLCLPGFALAAPAQPVSHGNNYVDAYYAFTNYEVDGVDDDLDGSSGGLRLWMGRGYGLFTLQAQGGELDGDVLGTKVEADFDNFRAGLGARLIDDSIGSAWLRAEYVRFHVKLTAEDIGSVSDTQNGYGLHAGGALGTADFKVYGEFGRLDFEDVDGYEYTVGLNWQPGIVGGFAEYRVTDLETDEFNIDEKFEDIRVGVRVAFD